MAEEGVGGRGRWGSVSREGRARVREKEEKKKERSKVVDREGRRG